MLTPSGIPNEHPYWYGTKIVEKNPCKRSRACYFAQVRKVSHNLVVGPEGKMGATPTLQHTSGPSLFSGLKVAEAAGTPVAAATTNGDGPICPGVTKLKPVTGSSDGERLKSAAGPIYPRGSERNPKQDDRPQLGWWAPGEYYNLCRRCHEYFIGDKRAGYCADCAYASGGHTIGVRPPGQTEGDFIRQAVRGFDTAFTRNSSPVGFTLEARP